MAEAVGDRGRFEAAVHHAIRALFIVADAVGILVGFLHQLLERADKTLAEQITGPLPAEDVARRISPRRAVIGLIAREEIEEHGGLAERPCLAAAAARKNPAKPFT